MKTEEPIIKLKGDEFLPVPEKPLIARIADYFNSIGGEAYSAFGVVTLDKKGVKNSSKHANYRNKTIAYKAIKPVLEEGEISEPWGYHNVHGKKQPGGTISGIIQIGEGYFRCDVRVIGNLQGKIRLYCHDVYQIKKTPKG